MSDFLDLTGNRYGHLTAIRRDGKNENGQTMWLLKCDCGREISLPMSEFKYERNKNRSCGCMKSRDITGMKFNRLTVIKKDGVYKSGNIRWLCQCECGEFTHTNSYLLRKGKAISCGCYASERISNANHKHGGFGTRLYEIWRQMHRRCYGENTKNYYNYGGRGIKICKEWKGNFEAFEKWSLANGYTEDLTIDRIDVNGDYCPENCRWATMKQQANNKRNSHYIEYGEEKHTISEWADIYGVEQRRLYDRLSRNGWELDLALASLGIFID